MDHLIQSRRPDLVFINKKKRTRHLADFAAKADHRVKEKENETLDKYSELARELKKAVEYERDSDTNTSW